MNLKRNFVISTFGLFAALIAYSVLIEPYRIEITHLKIEKPHLKLERVLKSLLSNAFLSNLIRI